MVDLNPYGTVVVGMPDNWSGVPMHRLGRPPDGRGCSFPNVFSLFFRRVFCLVSLRSNDNHDAQLCKNLSRGSNVRDATDNNKDDLALSVHRLEGPHPIVQPLGRQTHTILVAIMAEPDSSPRPVQPTLNRQTDGSTVSTHRDSSAVALFLLLCRGYIFGFGQILLARFPFLPCLGLAVLAAPRVFLLLGGQDERFSTNTWDEH